MIDRDPFDVALAELVPPFDDDSDGWNDVLRRAYAQQPDPQAPQPSERRRRRPRRAMQRWQLRTAVGVLAAAAVIATPAGRAGAEWVGDTLGVEIGDPPTEHRPLGDAEAPASYVIAAGRDPDGARYELVVDRYAHGAEIADGERVTSCVSLDWPDTGPGPSSFCGPGFPPYQQGGRAPGGVPARPFGDLNLYPPAFTRYLVLYGFTDSDVKRVTVSYASADGSRRDATVDLTELSEEVLRRIGSSKPVNVFVAFLPSSAGTDERHSSKTLEVVAYDAAGQELGRVRHDNGTNPSITEGPAPERSDR
jgi:hypothetical protein